MYRVETKGVETHRAYDLGFPSVTFQLQNTLKKKINSVKPVLCDHCLERPPGS